MSGLDSKPAVTTADGQKPRGAMLTWLVAGAVVLALAGGAGLWLMSEGEKEIVAAGTAPLPATPSPAAALASEAPTMRGTADDVSTAAILEDAPPLAEKPNPADSKKQAIDELTKMLEDGIPAAEPKNGAGPALVVADGKANSTEGVRPVAPVRTVKPARTAAKAPPKKPAVAVRAQASNIAPRPRAVASAPAKKKVVVKPAVPVDNDVALLAALVAHSKATQPKTGTGVTAKLKQCKSLDSVAEADQCRARICAGAKNELACKS